MLFYKQHFHKQCQVGNTLRLNFCFLKIIHILHPRFHPKTRKNTQKNKCVCAHKIRRLIIMKMKMKNRTRSAHEHKYSKYKKVHSIITLTCIKGALSGLRQFLANERPLKVMKNAFYFTLKAHFVLKIFKFLSRIFRHVEKRLD